MIGLGRPAGVGPRQRRAQRWQFEMMPVIWLLIWLLFWPRAWSNVVPYALRVQATALSMLLVGLGWLVSAAELAVPHANDQRLLPGGVIAADVSNKVSNKEI